MAKVTTAAGQPSPVFRLDPRRWIALTLLCLCQLMLILDVTVVNVALPDIGVDLRLHGTTLPWVITAYTLVFGGLVLLGGRAADAFGARRVLLMGLAVSTADHGGARNRPPGEPRRGLRRSRTHRSVCTNCGSSSQSMTSPYPRRAGRRGRRWVGCTPRSPCFKSSAAIDRAPRLAVVTIATPCQARNQKSEFEHSCMR